jgi:hypothetical protein
VRDLWDDAFALFDSRDGAKTHHLRQRQDGPSEASGCETLPPDRKVCSAKHRDVVYLSICSFSRLNPHASPQLVFAPGVAARLVQNEFVIVLLAICCIEVSGRHVSVVGEYEGIVRRGRFSVDCRIGSIAPRTGLRSGPLSYAASRQALWWSLRGRRMIGGRQAEDHEGM